MRKLSNSLLLLVLALYPVLVYFGLQVFSLQTLALVILLLFLVRIWFVCKKGSEASLHFLKPMLIPVALGGALLSLATLFLRSEAALLYYPCLVSLTGLIAFGWTLFKPPSMIECFARIVDGDLPPEGVRYTRNVTIVWCLFFLINGLIAFYTVVSNDRAFWAIYNGLISYILMGLLFALEWVWRKWVLKIQS